MKILKIGGPLVINVFGVIFPIVAGFLLTFLNRYSNLSQTIKDELNAVESARDFLVYKDHRQQVEIDKIKRKLANYVTSWPTMCA